MTDETPAFLAWRRTLKMGIGPYLDDLLLQAWCAGRVPQPEPAAPTVAEPDSAMDAFTDAADLVDAMRQSENNGEAVALVLKYRKACLAATPPRAALTDDAVRRAARVLSDRTAKACGIDKGDEWATYYEEHIDDARAALEAAIAGGPRNE